MVERAYAKLLKRSKGDTSVILAKPGKTKHRRERRKDHAVSTASKPERRSHMQSIVDIPGQARYANVLHYCFQSKDSKLKTQNSKLKFQNSNFKTQISKLKISKLKTQRLSSGVQKKPFKHTPFVAFIWH